MSSSKIMSARHVLRGILRKLRINKEDLPVKRTQTPLSSALSSSAAAVPSTTDNSYDDMTSATRNYVLSLYRQASLDREEKREFDKSTTDSSAGKKYDKQIQRQKLLLAENYLTLRNDLDERKRLQWLDAGVETKLSPREMSRRAAARAGLQLPDLDPNLK